MKKYPLIKTFRGYQKRDTQVNKIFERSNFDEKNFIFHKYASLFIQKIMPEHSTA